MALATSDLPAIETLVLDERVLVQTRIDAINVELRAMGPQVYSSLPEGTMDVVEFKQRLAKLQNLRTERENGCSMRRNPEHERILVEQSKGALIHFLENTKPIDAGRFLARKHLLLDEKLKLLEASASYCLSYIF